MKYPTKSGQEFTTITDNTRTFFVWRFIVSHYQLNDRTKYKTLSKAKKIMNGFKNVLVITTCGRYMPVTNCTKSK